MREWYRELREDYNVSRSYHEGFCEWYIKRKGQIVLNLFYLMPFFYSQSVYGQILYFV